MIDMKFPWTKAKKKVAPGEEKWGKKPPAKKLAGSLDENILLIKELFMDVDLVRYRQIETGADGGSLAPVLNLL